ncbi:MAG: MBL fold metallo-hydrolase [Clostridia bacterium]|nr:MBL fold metallo-hydrolase [Clostridia bacterium]
MYGNLSVLNHSTVKIVGGKVVYIDPYGLKNVTQDADYIFITHSHYDHYSPEDIEKVSKDTTTIIVTSDLAEKARELGFGVENILTVLPQETHELNGLKFTTIPSYNNLKPFHPKRNNWVGYLIELDGKTYYITGDTDKTLEAEKVKCDVLFVPVGGTFTMDYKAAANLTNMIKPKVAIPIHYGSIVGSSDDAKNFASLLDGIECKILM